MSLKKCLVPIIIFITLLYSATGNPIQISGLNWLTEALTISGVPGKLLVFGKNASVLLADSSGNVTAASLQSGKGRGIVLSHTDFLYPGRGISSNNDSTLFGWINWLIDGKIKNKIGVVGFAELALQPENIEITCYSKKLPDSLTDFTLLIINLQDDLNISEQERLSDYLQNGGAVLCSAMGWVWRKYSEHGKMKKPISTFSANKWLEPYGIKVIDGYSNSTIYGVRDQRFHLQNTTVEILSMINNYDSVTVDEQNRLTDFINVKLEQLSFPNQLLDSATILQLAELFKSRFNNRMPTKELSVKNSQSYHLLLINLINLLMKSQNWVSLAPLFGELKSEFPGWSGEKPALDQYEITIVNNGFTRQSCGLYALPGEKIVIKLRRLGLSEG